MLKKFKILDQRGDTIVEVLIAVVVISSMLVGTFAIANKSSSQIRSSQERTEATKLTTSVIEILKGAKDINGLETSNKWYCFNFISNDAVKSKADKTAMFDTLPPVGDVDDTNTSFNSDCKTTPNNGVEYFVFVKYYPNNKHEFTARWDKVSGGREQLTMVYQP